MTEQTQVWLRELHLGAMAKAYSQQLELSISATLGFDERLALLVQAEVESRRSKKLSRLLKTANLKDKGACLEAACSKARRLGNISYRVIINILKNNQEDLPLLCAMEQTVTPPHENLRGQTAFM